MRNRNNAKYLTGLFQMKNVMELQLQFCTDTTRADLNHPWRNEYIQNLLRVLGPDVQSHFILTMDWARDAIDTNVLHDAIIHYYQKTRGLRARPCGDCGRWSVLNAATQLLLKQSGTITSTDIVWTAKKSRSLMQRGKKMGHCVLCAALVPSKKKKAGANTQNHLQLLKLTWCFVRKQAAMIPPPQRSLVLTTSMVRGTLPRQSTTTKRSILTPPTTAKKVVSPP